MYDALLQFLQASPILNNPQIIELKTYGPNAFQVKIRAAEIEHYVSTLLTPQ
jgi:hypothetical protein